MALCVLAPTAHAQDVAAAPADDAAVPQTAPLTSPAAADGEVTVTGSRIVRDGYSAPTPVSVISTEEINREAPANISDFVNTLPAVRGSATAASSNGALSNGQAGVATVNLRNLGANRTLVLLDGQRSVASTTDGTFDVNTIPQALIERVEVVTGGASSAYGSDAVSGVVNFILNKKFTGIKAEYEYGVTTYGDGDNHKASLSAGTSFAEGRGHVIVSGEYFTQDGIQSIDRDWNDSGFFQIDNPAYSAAACTDNNPATACVNARLIQKGIGSGNFTPGGLITGARNAAGQTVAIPSALVNRYFGTIDPTTGRATVNQLAVGPRSSQWMIGGDYKLASQDHVGSATLLPSEKRKSAFARASWEFAPWLNVYGQFGYSYYRGESYYQLTPSQGTSAGSTSGVPISIDNPYLPDAVRAAMVANNLSSIVISTGNTGLPPQGSDMKREVFRYVAGADGDFEALGRDWHWQGYYQKGVTKTDELLTNAWNYDRMAKATDAVSVNGTISCRVNVDANPNNDDPACLPLNRIGTGGMNPAAIDYVLYNGQQPLREQKLQQDIVAVSFATSNLFENWAGPISLAFGAEYRKEQVNGTVDALFAPVQSAPDANGIISLTPTWRYGNYIPTIGSYNVKEAFVETVVPLMRGMDLNGALRITDYSTSGQVETWKVGLTWQAIDDIKLRGTISRDIRAPNLGELFNAGGGATNAVIRPTGTGGTVSDTYINSMIGNAGLDPEVARTYGAGAVFTPTFLPGFAASVDYYRIKLSGAIATLSAQTLVDQCYLQNVLDSCNYVVTTAGRGDPTPGLDITSVIIQPRNFVERKAEGIDFEASYRSRLGPGTVQLRALANYAMKLTTNNGVDPVTDLAGENTGNLPDWTFRLSAAYNLDNGFSVQAIGRGVSSGKYNNSYIVCTVDCPLSTVANRTVNTNHIDGAWFFDLNADYKFQVSSVKGTAFVSIRNVFNRDPVLVANGPTGDNTEAYPQTNRNLYDVLGRVFRMGLRFDY